MSSIEEQAEKRRKLIEERKMERPQIVSSEAETKEEEEEITKYLEKLNQLRNQYIGFNRKKTSKIGDTGSEIEDIGSKIGDTGSKIEDTGSEIEDIGSKIEDTGSEIEDTGSKIGDTVSDEFNHIGFSETVNRKSKSKKSIPLSINLCPNIFKNGSKLNSKYYFPSQFPNITTTKSYSSSVKTGGKITKRFHKKNKCKSNKKNKYKTNKLKTRKCKF